MWCCHHLGFPKVNFQTLALKASFHFENLFLSPMIVSVIRTKSPAYNNSPSAPSLANSVTTSTTNSKTKGDSTDRLYIPILTSNSTDNSESTLTLVFTPSYRLITGLAKSSGIPFLLNTHSNTFLGTLSKASSRSTKQIYNFFP